MAQPTQGNLAASKELQMLVRAEVEFLGSWEPITIEQALEISRRRIIRCPDCGKRLRIHKARADGRSPAHFEHWPKTGGCTPADAAADARGVDAGADQAAL